MALCKQESIVGLDSRSQAQVSCEGEQFIHQKWGKRGGSASARSFLEATICEKSGIGVREAWEKVVFFLTPFDPAAYYSLVAARFARRVRDSGTNG
jgi:hypothetical protein